MDITNNLITGSIGQIVTLHATYYRANWNFGTVFEAKVAMELAEFATRKTAPDLVLIAHDAKGVAASMILDLHDPISGKRGAHLRWFITAERCRGSGVGRQFLKTAVDHAERHTDGRIWLTTFAGLAPARHLYESVGFSLHNQAKGTAWGTSVTEQEFRR